MPEGESILYGEQKGGPWDRQQGVQIISRLYKFWHFNLPKLSETNKKFLDEDNNFDGPKFIQEMAASIQNTFEKRFPELSWQDKEDILHEIQLKLWKMILG